MEEIGKRKEKVYFSIGELDIASLTYNETLEYLEEDIKNNRKNFCVTLNTDILRITYCNEEHKNAVKNAGLITADGMPLVWLSKISGTPLPERIPGCDIVYDLCKLSNQNGYKIFMLGAAPGVADKAKEKLEKDMPNIKVVGTYSPDRSELESEEESAKIVNMINKSEAQILFIALGAPKQELWINKYIDSLNINVAIPCGGSIDFIAGEQKKSPAWIGKLGLEWLYRLASNPKKFYKRYLVDDLPFLFFLVFNTYSAKHINFQKVLNNVVASRGKIMETSNSEKAVVTQQQAGKLL